MASRPADLPALSGPRAIKQLYALVQDGGLVIEPPQVLELDEVAQAQTMLQDGAWNGPLPRPPQGA